jgi:4-diphosphocytidyl-2-C-methyl-D-erythritol kinase
MIVAGVTVRVPAKINLQLSVGAPRADGYHDLVTVFHAVSLFDDVTVEPADSGPANGDPGGGDPGDGDSVAVSGEFASAVPRDGDNLALRAVAALRAALPGFASPGPARPVRVTITKRIPVAAGLAGGSADAAATLVACNELWHAGLTQQQLCLLAASIGSDVAFCVLGGTAVGRGRGEQLTPALMPSTSYHWVLAFADGQLSTPAVYSALDRLRAGSAPAPPELDAGLMAALRAGDPVRVGKALRNDLQPAAVSLFPALRKTLAAGVEFGALGALVSGSGPTCAFLARSRERALDLAVALSSADVCRSVATASGPVPGAAIR